MLKELLVRLGLDKKGFEKGIGAAQRSLNTFAQGAQRSFNAVGKAANGLKNAVFSLNGAIATGLVVSVIRAADGFNQLQGKIKNVLGTGEAFGKVFDSIVASANRSGSSLDAVAAAFVRLKPAAERFGVTNDQLIKFNETFSKMGALAGATTGEINNAMIQLAQGIASGRLQGDELRTIFESMPPVVDAVAEAYSKRFGGSVEEVRGKLRDLAAEGKITPDLIFNALLTKADETDRKFATLPASVGRSFQQMVNSAQIFFGALNDVFNITGRTSEAINFLGGAINGATTAISSNKERTVQLTVAAVGLAGALGGAIGLNALIAALPGFMTSAAVAAGTLRVALLALASPVGILATALATLGAASAYAAMAPRSPMQQAAGLADKQKRLKKELQDLRSAEAGGPSRSTLNPLERQKRIRAIQAEAKAVEAESRKLAASFKKAPAASAGGGGVIPVFSGGGGGGGVKKSRAGRAASGKSEAQKEADQFKKDAEAFVESTRTISEKRKQAIDELNKMRAAYPKLITPEVYDRGMKKIAEDFAPDIKGAVEEMDTVLNRFFENAAKGIEDLGSEGVKTSEEFNALFEDYKQLLAEIQTPQEKYAEQMARLAEISKEYGLTQDQVNAATKMYGEELKNAGKTSESARDQIVGVMRGIGQSTEDALINVFKDGQFSAKEFFASILEDIARLIFRLTVLQPLMEKLESWGKGKASASSGGKGGFFSNLAGGLVKGILGFANGGRPPVNRPSIVGERGPELFMPSTSGTVIPNHKLGGGGGAYTVNQNVNITGDVTSQVRAEVLRMLPSLRRDVENQIKSQIINGGSMARAVGRTR